MHSYSHLLIPLTEEYIFRCKKYFLFCKWVSLSNKNIYTSLKLDQFRGKTA